MTRARNVRESKQDQWLERSTHIAKQRRNVRLAQNSQAKTTARPQRTLRPFISPS